MAIQSTDVTTSELIVNQIPQDIYDAKKENDELDAGQLWLTPAAQGEGVVRISVQTLTEEQQAQARTNIGAEKAGTGYTKPTSGIPKSDLADDVQTSLAKADTAISLGLTAATPGQIIKVKTVQDGKPTEWEAADMPGGGGVQSDWNQNDETQLDYIKNRPFYTGDPVETVLVEESTVSFAAEGGMYLGQLESTFSATVGETYKVSWDGTVYECACGIFNNMPFIGNLSIIGAGSDTGEPFIMGILNGEGIQIMTADTSASHTVSISGFVSEVVKIDAKYLPDTVATKSEVEEVRSIAENGKIDPHVENNPATLYSAASEFIGWYETMPILYYDQTVGNFFYSGDNTDPIKIKDIHFGRFMCLAYLTFPGVSDGWHIMYISTESTVVGDKAFVAGPAISPKGNMFYVKSNEVDGNTAEGIFFELLMPEYMMINSSTSGSDKKFKITVDDSGVITATEVT